MEYILLQHLENLMDMEKLTGIVSKTNDICPQDGEWVTLEDLSYSVTVNKGEKMPPFKGRSVSWQYKDHEPQLAGL